MATESELNEDQYRLLRAFNERAEATPQPTRRSAMRRGRLSPIRTLSRVRRGVELLGGRRVFDSAGDEKYGVTVAGINEVQRRPQP